LLIVTETEPVPLRFAVNVYPSLTNTAVAVRLPDTDGTDTVLPSEFNDGVVLIHLENVLPGPVAASDTELPEAIGISAVDVIVYTSLFIVTSTEPAVPLRFADNV